MNSYRWEEAGAILAGLIVLVLIIEWISTKIRVKLARVEYGKKIPYLLYLGHTRPHLPRELRGQLPEDSGLLNIAQELRKRQEHACWTGDSLKVRRSLSSPRAPGQLETRPVARCPQRHRARLLRSATTTQLRLRPCAAKDAIGRSVSTQSLDLGGGLRE